MSKEKMIEFNKHWKEMDKEQAKKHHPFCVTLYRKQDSWRCVCDILKEYDKWRTCYVPNAGLRTPDGIKPEDCICNPIPVESAPEIPTYPETMELKEKLNQISSCLRWLYNQAGVKGEKT